MIGRYRMVRGKRPPGDPLPKGRRFDTRMHTKHVLRPPRALVESYLASPGPARWQTFAREYLAVLETRRTADPSAFDVLAELARHDDVSLGCSCPTTKNPDVRRCHTVLALRFMQQHYPDLEVVFPEGV